MEKLSEAEIARAVAECASWACDGQVIAKTYEFEDFPAAMRFVNEVATVAEARWHHPDIDIRWNRVALRLTTHDSGGLTRKDFELARAFDGVAAAGSSPADAGNPTKET